MSLHLGQRASVKRTFTQSDFDRFAALSGDDNPIHVDPAFSADTRFGRTVAHGMFLYSVVSSVLGTRLPGPGTLQIEQELMFPTATPAGEEVEIRLETTDLQPASGLADLDVFVLRPNGQVGLQGRARVLLPAFPAPPDAATATIAAPESRQPVRQDLGPGGPALKGLRLGQRAHILRKFSAADLAEYVDLTADANPLYTCREYARDRGLEAPLVPGGLLGGLFSCLLGTRLPGPGTNYLKQRLHFPALAYVDRPLEASVEVTRLRPAKQLVNLSTLCTGTGGHVVCHGEALVLVSDL